MIVDITGKKRYKVGLHIHTTLSDGAKTPEEVAAIYRAAGYDAIALTDHWVAGMGGSMDGLTVLPGCEYNTPENGGEKGVYHVLGIGYRQAPVLSYDAGVQEIIDGIHAMGGMAILAHPAWSLNDPAIVAGLHGIDATEIYNTVSGLHASNRPYSGEFVDLLADRGVILPLTAADDSHYYDGDETVAYVMVAAEDGSQEALMDALQSGDFYATQGPEVHIRREGDRICVDCSPAVRVSFYSNIVWTAERNQTGEALTAATYPIHRGEFFVRAEVTDADGRVGYSQILRI